MRRDGAPFSLTIIGPSGRFLEADGRTAGARAVLWITDTTIQGLEDSGARARGLGTCWVGAPMLWLRTPAAKTELAIPAALKPAVAMCLGYAQIIPEPPARGVPVIIWRS